MRTNGARWRLRLLDQPDERRVGALRRRPVGPNLERRAGVRRAAEHRHARRERHRQRLAAERARVDDRLGADDRAVDRDHLAGAHDHDVADLDPLDRHLLEAARRRAAARPSGRAGPARSARAARASRRRPRAPRRRRTSARSRRRRAPRPSASAPTIATSAIVSTPMWWSTTTVRPTSNASSAASSATAARQTRSPGRASPARCSAPPTTIDTRARPARMRDRYSTNHRQARPPKEPEGTPCVERPTTDAAADDITPSIPAIAVGNIRTTTPPRLSKSPQSHAHAAGARRSRGREHDRPVNPTASPSTRRHPVARLADAKEQLRVLAGPCSPAGTRRASARVTRPRPVARRPAPTRPGLLRCRRRRHRSGCRRRRPG